MSSETILMIGNEKAVNTRYVFNGLHWSMLCWVLICMIRLTKFAKSIVAIGKIF